MARVGPGALVLAFLCCVASSTSGDLLNELQRSAVSSGASEAAHWGTDATRYSTWSAHSNRLIPVYAYGASSGDAGVDLTRYTGANSVYRHEERLRRLYGGPAADSVSDAADYLDQTNIYDLQAAALAAGKKYIFLVVFDGMDWDTTRAASIWNLQRVAYAEGRGSGTHFQDYDADGTSQFSWMVTSPYRDGTQVDVNAQRVKNPGGGLAGGYRPELGGITPWTTATEPEYLIAGPKDGPVRHAYADSASSATSMTSGVKTYNGAINVDPYGAQLATIAHRAQRAGYRVGVVTSVPISHATPAAAYAHNVHREDYQDLARDLLGLPSISHPKQPLDGMDVVIGAGYGVEKNANKAQGDNFVPGNDYLTDADMKAADVNHGGRYVVSVRSPGEPGGSHLVAAAQRAAREGRRLLGFYGVGGEKKHVGGHLPFASADRDYCPAPGLNGEPIVYSEDEITENPTLAEMTSAALIVLGKNNNRGFWLMVEEGDVDWANHGNNLDASIGAVNSGDEAVKIITDWVEANSNWQESLMIVTGDHGHYLHLDRPELLIRPSNAVSAGGN